MRVVVFLFSLCFFVSAAFSVDVAPRISDREVIESLVELREGQRGLQQQIADLRAFTQQQIGDLRAFTQQQIGDLKAYNDKRLDALQIQIGDLKTSMQQQLEILRATIWLFVSITLVILGAMAKILWEHQKQLTVLHAVLKTQKDRFSAPKHSA
jgi:hypothetical protein